MVPDPIVEEGVTNTPRTAARRERRDAAGNRQRILVVARDLFAHQGVAAVTMHQIAQAAGIGQGTLYRRYANKADLCLDLMHEQHERFTAVLHATLTDDRDTPALARLDAVLLHTLSFVNESLALLETVVAAQMQHMHCAGDSPFARTPAPRLDWGPQWGHTIITGLLEEAVAHGELAPLDVAYTADLMLSAMNPMALRYQLSERGYSLERIAAGLRHIFITGIHATDTAHQSMTEG